MNGFRSLGKRKSDLINGPLKKQLTRLRKLGIRGEIYLKMVYGIFKAEDFIKIPTKKISGIIGSLGEIK